MTRPSPHAAAPAPAEARAPATLGISLDIARGLAALLVFGFHLSGYLTQLSPALGALARHGYMGVPIFFVISGYCMAASAHQSLRRNRSAASFLRKRFLRIYPAFWASIAVIIVTPYLLAALSVLKTGSFVAPEPRWLTLSPTEWVQFLTLTRVFFSNGQGLDAAFSPLNIVYWTLAIEFQFYLVIYAALLWRKWFAAILTATTLLSLLVFAYPSIKDTGLFLGFWPMFALGLGLYLVLDKDYPLRNLAGHRGQWLAAAILALSLLAFTALALQGVMVTVLERVFSDDAFGFAVCTAVAFWLLSWLEPRIAAQASTGRLPVRLPLKAGVFLGSISYSIYLLHTKLYQIPEMFVRQVATPEGPFYTLAIIGGTIALSWWFHRHFERPFISRPAPR